MPQRPLNVGLIGGGGGAFIVQPHQRAIFFDGTRRVTCAALHPDPAVAMKEAEEWPYPIQGYTSYDELIEQEIKIKPHLFGDPPNGLKLRSVTVFPEKVDVLYPKVDGITRVETLSTTPIYLEGIHQDTKVISKVIAPPSIQPKDKRWPDVEVYITLDHHR